MLYKNAQMQELAATRENIAASAYSNNNCVPHFIATSTRLLTSNLLAQGHYTAKHLIYKHLGTKRFVQGTYLIHEVLHILGAEYFSTPSG